MLPSGTCAFINRLQRGMCGLWSATTQELSGVAGPPAELQRGINNIQPTSAHFIKSCDKKRYTGKCLAKKPNRKCRYQLVCTKILCIYSKLGKYFFGQKQRTYTDHEILDSNRFNRLCSSSAVMMSEHKLSGFHAVTPMVEVAKVVVP